MKTLAAILTALIIGTPIAWWIAKQFQEAVDRLP